MLVYYNWEFATTKCAISSINCNNIRHDPYLYLKHLDCLTKPDYSLTAATDNFVELVILLKNSYIIFFTVFCKLQCIFCWCTLPFYTDKCLWKKFFQCTLCSVNIANKFYSFLKAWYEVQKGNGTKLFLWKKVH